MGGGEGGDLKLGRLLLVADEHHPLTLYPWQKFSKVSALVHLLYRVTI
jgi:hypothetical protein